MTDQQLKPEENSNDKLSTGLLILSFLIPLVGAIIYFNSKSESPKKAKKACHAALWGIGVSLVLQVIATLMAGGL